MKKSKYVLGLNDGHNGTACLIADGEILTCVSEERFTRVKNQAGIPVKAIKYCLTENGIAEKDIDKIVFGGNLVPPTTQKSVNNNQNIDLIYKYLKSVLTIARMQSVRFPYLRDLEENLYPQISNLLMSSVQKKRKAGLCEDFKFQKDKIEFIDHHYCHAQTVLYASGFIDKYKDILIFTCDGEGDSLSASVSTYKNGKFKTISTTSMTNSLGNLYRSVTKYLGMKPLEHEYKVMGLAAYVKEDDSKALELYKKFKDLIWVDKKTLQIKTKVNSQLFKLGYLDKLLTGYRFDYVGYATQRLTEDVLTDWVEAVISKTKINNVLLSGGVFMNVKANQKISEVEGVKNIFIMPSCSDESNAIGAAYWGYKNLTNKNPKPIENLYLGTEYSNSEILKSIDKKKRKSWKIKKSRNIEKDVAKLIASGEIVARFNGRMEWGARALGNRSILADPTHLEVLSTINKMIKSRDFWMPFAPVVMAEHHKKYLHNPKNVDAPYMIITFDTTEKGKDALKAAIHQYDKSARPQIIDKKLNESYYSILKEFSKITKRHGLLNTSFNLHGYPIVESPRDAMHVFANSGLKYLAIGNYLVSKKLTKF